MNKIILSLITLMVSVSIQAQVVKVRENGVLKYMGVNSAQKQIKVVFETSEDSNFQSGLFSVSHLKQVQFAKCNIYWNGSEFKYENKPTDYQTSWDVNHVSHFYWTKNATHSYAENFKDGICTDSDVPFFAESKGGITVEGRKGLFVLESTEFFYLLNSRDNADKLYKSRVTVDKTKNCLILAPDNFAGTLKDTYTLEEINSLGLVCLAPCGERYGNSINANSTVYWESSPYEPSSAFAYELLGFINAYYTCERRMGLPIRLVTLP